MDIRSTQSPAARAAVVGRSRPHTIRERVADAGVHVVGLSAALVGAVVLVARAADLPEVGTLVAVSIYAVGLVTMLGASAAYNLGYETSWRMTLRRLDHIGIFLMIAATYTPFTTRVLDGWIGVSLTVAVWTGAVAGIALKLVDSGRFERLNVALYLLLGWLVVIAAWPLASAVGLPVLGALVAGALLYTGGVVFHLWEELPFHNAIWHLFVLGAAGCHYGAVLTGVVLKG